METNNSETKSREIAIKFAEWLPMNAVIEKDEYYYVSLATSKIIEASELFDIFLSETNIATSSEEHPKQVFSKEDMRKMYMFGRGDISVNWEKNCEEAINSLHPPQVEKKVCELCKGEKEIYSKHTGLNYHCPECVNIDKVEPNDGVAVEKCTHPIGDRSFAGSGYIHCYRCGEDFK